jgi:alkanesulfonate monooxygenase SsuD/methylene tetrahydromethanopterin reductase-like flavin-dependent oxidoreductase (luciferase family)
VQAGFSQETQLQKDRDDDTHNRRIFEDNIELVVKAWTQESFTHNGPAWQVPYPYEAGIEDWPLARAGVTQKLGAPGEVDAQGVWRRASVAPAPYTRPHPKVFVAGSGSPETIEFCGKHGFVPTYFASIAAAGPLSERYRTYALDTINDFGLSVNHQKSASRTHLMQWLDEVFDVLVPDGSLNLAGLSAYVGCPLRRRYIFFTHLTISRFLRR